MIQPVPQHGDATTLRLAVINTRPQIRTRNGFDADSLGELAASIRTHGLLQPVVVAPRPDGEFDLIAGERRLLAASMAGLDEVPAIVRTGTVAELAAAQAVENLQRQDLHPADVAEGLEALASVYPSWREVARAVGKSPAWVSKHRALLRLRPITRALMTEGHTADIELLASMNQLEKQNPARAATLADLIAEGKAGRAEVRAHLALVNLPAPTDAAEGDTEAAAPEAPKPADPTKARKVPKIEFTVAQLRALNEFLKVHVPHVYPDDMRDLANAATKVEAAWDELMGR